MVENLCGIMKITLENGGDVLINGFGKSCVSDGLLRKSCRTQIFVYSNGKEKYNEDEDEEEE